jgi:hypothetical protein
VDFKIIPCVIDSLPQPITEGANIKSASIKIVNNIISIRGGDNIDLFFDIDTIPTFHNDDY